jgi:hypothetical protein
MTDRPSQIINPCWLLHAGPAQGHLRRSAVSAVPDHKSTSPGKHCTTTGPGSPCVQPRDTPETLR